MDSGGLRSVRRGESDPEERGIADCVYPADRQDRTILNTGRAGREEYFHAAVFRCPAGAGRYRVYPGCCHSPEVRAQPAGTCPVLDEACVPSGSTAQLDALGGMVLVKPGESLYNEEKYLSRTERMLKDDDS